MLQINISFAPFLLVPSIRYGSWNQALGRAASRIAIALTNRVCIRDSIHTISSEIYGSLLSDRAETLLFSSPSPQPCSIHRTNLASSSFSLNFYEYINFILLFTPSPSFSSLTIKFFSSKSNNRRLYWRYIILLSRSSFFMRAIKGGKRNFSNLLFLSLFLFRLIEDQQSASIKRIF